MEKEPDTSLGPLCCVSSSFSWKCEVVVIGNFQASERGGLRISIISLSMLGFLVSLCAEVHLSLLRYRSVGMATM